MTTVQKKNVILTFNLIKLIEYLTKFNSNKKKYIKQYNIDMRKEKWTNLKRDDSQTYNL